jgi:hypothetical protein
VITWFTARTVKSTPVAVNVTVVEATDPPVRATVPAETVGLCVIVNPVGDTALTNALVVLRLDLDIPVTVT